MRSSMLVKTVCKYYISFHSVISFLNEKLNINTQPQWCKSGWRKSKAIWIVLLRVSREVSFFLAVFSSDSVLFVGSMYVFESGRESFWEQCSAYSKIYLQLLQNFLHCFNHSNKALSVTFPEWWSVSCLLKSMKPAGTLQCYGSASVMEK